MNDPKALAAIYSEDYDAVRVNLTSAVDQIKELGGMMQADVLSEKKRTMNMAEFLKNYHRYPRKVFESHVLYQELMQGREQGMDGMECVLWPDNHDIVPMVRVVIEHFDELEPKGRRDTKNGGCKLNGKVMARLVKWCRPTNAKDFIESYFNERYKGVYRTIRHNSVNSAKNSVKGGAQTDAENAEYAAFVAKVEALLSKYGSQKPVAMGMASGF